MLKEMLSCIRYKRLSRWRVVPKINCLSHYQVLVTAADLALQLNETQQAIAWSTNATALKGRYNEAFWDDSAGLYSDNLTTTLHPQDANSLAVVFNLTDSEDQKQRISDGLKENWDSLGPVPPELPDTISPFITGFEVCFIAFCKIGKKTDRQCQASSPFYRWRGYAGNESSWTNVGVYAIHQSFRTEHAFGRFHGERITEVLSLTFVLVRNWGWSQLSL